MTDEHSVPRAMFPTEKRANLIKVPACDACNQSYKKDDEYFRTVIAGASFADPVGRRIWDEKVVRSTLKRSPRLSAALVSRLVDIDIKTPAGVYLGIQEALLVDFGRVNRVLEKIVRGLYFHHEGRRLSKQIKISIRSAPSGGDLEGIGEEVVHCTIGDGSVFQYGYRIHEGDRRISVWFFCFYRSVIFAVITGHRPCDTSTPPRAGRSVLD
jgi:hypothetical protein